MLMRDSGSPRSTTRISARSTSSRPGGLLARLLLQRFLRTQTSQSTPVVFPAQTLRRSSQIWRFGECLPQILWLFCGFLFFFISFLISKMPTLLPRWLPFYRLRIPVFRFFRDGMGLWLLRYGQTWDLACYATVLGKAWLSCLDSRAGEQVLPTAVDRVSSPLDL